MLKIYFIIATFVFIVAFLFGSSILIYGILSENITVKEVLQIVRSFLFFCLGLALFWCVGLFLTLIIVVIAIYIWDKAMRKLDKEDRISFFRFYLNRLD